MKSDPVVPRDRWLDRVAAEPFRLFFPLGILASVVGVLLWPAYFFGWFSTWPLELHARWMVVGFGGSFVVGFLGTAGPRLIGAPPWCRFEFILHFGLAMAVLIGLSCGRVSTADGLTGFWWTAVLCSQLLRLAFLRQALINHFLIKGDFVPARVL